MLFNHNAIDAGVYQINNSLRFISANSQYLSRTFTNSNNSFTFSIWVKRGLINGSERNLLGVNTGGADWFGFNTSEQLTLFAGSATRITTTAVYRDPAAWYHIVLSRNGGQGGTTSVWNLYVNGSSVGTFTGTGGGFLSAVTHGIGYKTSAVSQLHDGYFAEINLIDGQALTPSYFGQNDIATGQWVAKKYNGTYGTNGFYLNFSNGTSTTTLGADSSGNSNNWTLTNFTRSAGASDCWMVDVPSGNGSGGGTRPNGNYCTLLSNHLGQATGTGLSEANLKANFDGAYPGSIEVNSGKYYWEVVWTGSTGSPFPAVGIYRTSDTAFRNGFAYGISTSSYVYYYDGRKKTNNTLTTYGASWTTNDVIGVALDLDAGTITFYKNNVSQGTAFTGLTGSFVPEISVSNNIVTMVCNFGQREFTYTPPSGFVALCTANLPQPTISRPNVYMDATLYVGNVSGGITVNNEAGFSPDLVWIKDRSFTYSHGIFDTVRGATKYLSSNTSDPETTDATSLTSFTSTGFTSGNSNITGKNASESYVAWQWDAGNSTVTNTSGSITSQVRANPTAGFSIVTYTGTGSNATVGHGLGVAPAMILVKRTSTLRDWNVYHKSIGAGNFLILNTTAAPGAGAAWNSTDPVSSVFSIGTALATNAASETYVAYCFAEIPGYSRISTYNGNANADGPVVFTGFRPKYVMWKRTDSTGSASWWIQDGARNPYNPTGLALQGELDAIESDGTPTFDFVSNGFKIRTTQSGTNATNGTYVFIAFAESPFKYSNAR